LRNYTQIALAANGPLLAIYEEVFVNRGGCIFFPFSADALEKLARVSG
jgi:hypothetical protein